MSVEEMQVWSDPSTLQRTLLSECVRCSEFTRCHLPLSLCIVCMVLFKLKVFSQTEICQLWTFAVWAGSERMRLWIYYQPCFFHFQAVMKVIWFEVNASLASFSLFLPQSKAGVFLLDVPHDFRCHASLTCVAS